MNSMLLGRYIPGNSPVHQLDPRTKLLGCFYYIGIVFLANNWITYALLFVLTLGMLPLARVRLGFFLRGLRTIMFLILFTVLLQLFFTTGGHVWWQWGWLTVTSKGVLNAVYILCRLVLIIFASTLLTLTTQPLGLADAVESILKPLKKIHVPVTELALMLSIALRFVPTLMDQTTKTMNAQRARGVDFGSGGPIKQLKSIVPLFIPLFVSAFSMADDLATAMEARGFRGGDGRTRYRALAYHRGDVVAAILLVAVTVVLIVLRTH
ncbi:energy-coupling factor transporter transmembrane component T family protein [Lacticaseibacillus pantheris]|uniref:energy-coupling factor transporter transmembrane component T family protein n=1 Tax=Lacticaseibacillus pantheris TaxID=171523 RepID=UPI00265A5A89|nr:energy-coupling factor transporter transmembrane component T [Lacticaseibacillus pantheris]WKF84647.1 energy-coupling factor transporter transmembrane component T [Lacticaseibacillus pantheris]